MAGIQEIHLLSATEIVEKIRRQELTCREVAITYIERIQKINPYINAINQFFPERILKEADEADNAVKSKKPLGKLHGLPISIKDVNHVKGFKISKGCPAFLNETSQIDSTVASRLRSEGAIILGITNVPEFLASYETDNLIYGRTNNPYDLNRTPGGSSGGEAALISAGCSPVGIGSDAGGSIRQPAHYAGICGHKPTQNFVPNTGNAPVDGSGLLAQLICVGPMARHVDDLNLIMEIIAGADNIDPHCPPIKYGNTQEVDLKELKAAYYFNHQNTIPTPETTEALKAVIKALTPEIKSIQEDFPKQCENIHQLHMEPFFYGGDKGNGFKNLFKKLNHTNISPLFQQFLNLAEQCELSVSELRYRLMEVEQFRFSMMRYMENYDVLISPVAATPARFHGETHDHIPDFSYLITHNLTGWPATVIPVGYSTEGLPIGIQIAAKPWQDHVCIALAKKAQEIFGVFPVPTIKPT